MANFYETLKEVQSMLSDGKTRTMEQINRDRRINSYKKNMNNYGVYPVLDLMGEYEKEGKYEECSIILEAVREKYKEAKKLIPSIKDKKEPTHIRQFSDKMYRNMFDVFGLTGETAKKNTEAYKRLIKKDVG